MWPFKRKPKIEPPVFEKRFCIPREHCAQFAELYDQALSSTKHLIHYKLWDFIESQVLDVRQRSAKIDIVNHVTFVVVVTYHSKEDMKAFEEAAKKRKAETNIRAQEFKEALVSVGAVQPTEVLAAIDAPKSSGTGAGS